MNASISYLSDENLSEDITSELYSSAQVKNCPGIIKNMNNTPFRIQELSKRNKTSSQKYCTQFLSVKGASQFNKKWEKSRERTKSEICSSCPRKNELESNYASSEKFDKINSELKETISISSLLKEAIKIRKKSMWVDNTTESEASWSVSTQTNKSLPLAPRENVKRLSVINKLSKFRPQEKGKKLKSSLWNNMKILGEDSSERNYFETITVGDVKAAF